MVSIFTELVLGENVYGQGPRAICTLANRIPPHRRCATALYNWLFARRHSGTFILRIEDTDVERSTEASLNEILDGLRWLGLEWDEGPYFQSHYLKEHQESAQRLLASGHAYRCFCTKRGTGAQATGG